ncbi:MAG: amino acid adenylation domain-containing protein [Halanaerobiales bacterium]|nr:amino acid adenylation domain-containing protein [Halanaerobiales bacterium]
MPIVYELEGLIDHARIESTFNKLVARHDALRTYFQTNEDEIIQKVKAEHEFKMLVNRKDQEELGDLLQNFIRPFDLGQAPLFRAEILDSQDKSYLLIDMHHIISDGVSASLLIKEFVSLYNGEELGELRIQYKDFAEWQNQSLKTEEMKKQEEYWVNRFKEEIPVLNMPYDYERPLLQSFAGDELSFKVDEERTNCLRKIAREIGSTMHMVLLSAFNILLAKYCRQEEIIVGIPIAGRTHADLQNVMGMFVNTLALKNNLSGEKRYLEFLKEVKENSLNAYANQSYQFEELIDKVNVTRDTSRNPLFDVMFDMTNLNSDHSTEIELDGLVLKPYMNKNMVAKFDLILSAAEDDQSIVFKLEYCTKLFKEETINRMGNHYLEILKNICENNEVQLKDIEMITEEEKNQILYQFNDTQADYPTEKTIHELFEEQVNRAPDNIAVVFGDQKLSYQELNKKANSLARVLRNKGVKPDTVVTIMIDKSVEMVIGILAVLKSGGAYLPIEPSYPKERVEYMLEDSHSKILLSSKELYDTVDFDGEVMDLEDQDLFEGEVENLESINRSNNLAYIIYTSGTTGTPKGVMVEHRSLINLCEYHVNKFAVTEKDRATIYASLSFDACVWEMWPYLTIGASVYIIDNDIRLQIEKLNQYYNQNNITISFLPTQICERFIEQNNTSLRFLLTGGDRLKYFRKNRYKLVNNYGPTEATVATTNYVVEEEAKSIPIGKMINNAKVYILSAENKLAPIRVPGELCIAGDVLARGYWNRPELTAEKFVENPFKSGTRMYKTGDLARWMPDGNIEFLGRLDHQVKIRGFRIELGEIENRLLQHEAVKEVTVVVKGTQANEKYLCAYLICANPINELNLMSYLQECLPDYMVPSYFIQLEKMPLTPNGKVDRKSLPKPEVENNLVEYQAPSNEIEEKLTKIWSQVLGIERVGINDKFFDLGGHSLKATVLISRIHQELKREIQLRELFTSPTIKELSKLIKNAEENLCSKIERVEESEYYEASSAQKRMYTLQQLEQDSVAYNMPVVFAMEGAIDKSRIEETFIKLSLRHEVLRTYFETVEDEIVQKIDYSYEFKLVTRKENQEIESILNKFIRPFNLSKVPLFRVELVESAAQTYLLIDMHHIISDGVSMRILINEFIALYNGESLPTAKLQYKDFAAWQNNFMKSAEMKDQEEYWMNRFNDEIPVLNMLTDHERPVVQSFEGDRVSFELDEKNSAKVRKLARETDATIHMVLLSALNILLAKYSGQDDIVIGTPIAGRASTELENMMGMFVNTLALRNKPEGEKEYVSFLQEVKDNSLKAYENQSYQLEALIEKLEIRRDLSRNPLFDVMFNMVDTVAADDIKLDGLMLKQTNLQNKISKFDLTLNAQENGKTLDFTLEYCTKLFEKETIERLSNHYSAVLDEITNNNQIKISEIGLVTEQERDQILYGFNDTKCHYPKEKTIQRLFEEQVQRTPDNIAVLFEETQLTYSQLNEKANQLARKLRSLGVQADSIVGIMVERSLEMIIGIMGVIKAGGAYLPIDPNYPKKRIEYMLQDSESKILLSTESSVNQVEFNGQVIDLFNEDGFKGDASNLKPINNSQNLAYVIYTSGTTGNPKGVMVEHQGLVNRLNWVQKKYPLNQDDTILQKTTYTFDVSVWEIFWWSVVGAKVCMLEPEYEKDPVKIIAAINKYQITTIHFVPSMLDVFLYCLEANNVSMSLPSLRQVFSSGEALKFKQVSKFQQEFGFHKKLINLYGPTEATIEVSYFECDNQQNTTVPIGKPIDNIQLYILNNNQVAPIGLPGELYIAGDGVARGYLNRPELTAEKFVDNPFEANTKMYKTGDLVRWLPDGNIEFLGRIDHQVKIRGFRIELGEIENRLLKNRYVKEAAVVVKENSEKEDYVCAYVVSDTELRELDLKSYLKESLPEYMVPAYFVQLDKMPLTHNGKLNRNVLPEPNLDSILVEYVAPRNEIEAQLVEIWSQVLGIEGIGVYDNFFDLGGNSLKAIKVISRINKYLGVEVPLKSIFEKRTIESLYTEIKDLHSTTYKQIKPVQKSASYDVSNAQKRLWVLNQLEETGAAYNIPAAFLLEGEFDENAFRKAFDLMIERHESLRTVFITENGLPKQKILDNPDYSFYITDIKDHADVNESARELAIQNALLQFDLERGPLVQMSVIKMENNKHMLLVNMHHIISDGWSMNVFTREFLGFYNNFKKGKVPEIEPLKIQYKDYSTWQNELFESGAINSHREYWHKKLSGELPILDLPADRVRPITKTFRGQNIDFILAQDIQDRLYNLCKEKNISLFMMLQAIVKTLLYRYTGQEDIILGSPIAGRGHKDLEGQIGFYTNTLAIRDTVKGEEQFATLLDTVRETCVEAFDHQNYPFDKIVEEITLERDLSRSPIFDVMLVFQNNEAVTIEFDGLTVSPYELKNEISKFDISFIFDETVEGLNCSIEYNTDIYHEDRIQRMVKHFQTITASVVSNPQTKIRDLEILAEEEQKLLLDLFNDTAADYPLDKTIVLMFEEQVAKTPDNIAVIYEETKLTYRQLNERANIVANYLRDQYQIKPDDFVGIMIPRSEKMIIIVMGIMKSGAAYVPIDPIYPAERVDYILEDSDCKVAISDKTEGIFVNIKEILKSGAANTNPLIVTKPDNLAYVIYTSGSTGKPKATLLENRSLINRIDWMQKSYPIGESDTILQKTTYTFDVSVWEFFWWSLYGAKVCLLPPGGEKDPAVIVSSIEKNTITTMHFVPSMLNIFLDYVKAYDYSARLRSLKYIFSSGEALLGNHVEKCADLMNQNGTRLINLYGPTEAAIDVTYYNCLASDRTVPIGKPISNISLYIIDEDLKLAPVGVPGELCISGVGLARGYLNKPDLTKSSFVDNPFVPGERMYKTGDVARWLPDGQIEYLGRKDYQVKIRGFRIELEEIDHNIRKISGVEDSITIDFVDAKGDKQLCAYLVSNEELDLSYLRQELSKNLVNYMIPSYFVYLEKLPLNSNGKIDRKALIKPESIVSKEYIAPRNELEEKLRDFFAEILGFTQISIDDSFFELGGHSLRALQLILKIQKELRVEINLSEVFLYPTIAGMAEFIKNKQDRSFIEEIPKVEVQDHYPLSSAQNRLFFLNVLDKTTTAYNMPFAMILEGKVDKDRVSETFTKLIERHESLRTSFELLDNEPRQRVHQMVSFELEYGEIDHDLGLTIQSFIQPFDIANPPLLRAGLFKISAEKHLFVCDMHHIISDGVSMAVLIEEFGKIYTNQELPELQASYVDYTVWLQEYVKSEINVQAEEYWLAQFVDELLALNLPLDYQRPVVQSFSGSAVDFNISSRDTANLKKIALENNATLFMVLLSICNVFLAKICSQDDLIIGTPVAGRIHPDIDRTIGVFLNTLVLRNNIHADQTFTQFLSKVRENTLLALQNQSYQFEDLVEKVVRVRRTNRNPLFDVMFALNNMETRQLEIHGLNAIPYEYENESSKLDLKITALEISDQIKVNFNYNTNLFKRETINKFVGYFQSVMSSIIENSDLEISKIEVLNLEQRRGVLSNFNRNLLGDTRFTFQNRLNEALKEFGAECAISCGTRKITYSELDQKSNYVANYLINQRVGKGSFVPVAISNRADFIIAMIGVFKAGCIFVPFDLNQTRERLSDLISELNLQYMIVDDIFHQQVMAGTNFAQDVESFNFEKIFKGDNTDWFNTIPELEYRPDDMIYAYFTSGTTGNPKIIAGRSEGLVHFAEWEINQFGVGKGFRVSQLTRPTFDPFLRDIFVPLFAGGVVCIPNSEEINLNSIKLVKWIETERINLIHIVPSVFKIISDEDLTEGHFKELKYILLAGEKLYPSYLEKWYKVFANRIQLVNIYGPTETTLAKFFKLINMSDLDRGMIPVGKPIPGASGIVLNKDMNICDEMIPGELYIRTPYQSLGYINNDELNAKHFIVNPFTNDKQDIIYKTGDMAQVTTEGTFEILGRVDRQVKIRGQRIELEEIEGYLNSLEYVNECAVVHKERSTGDNFLCAYYTLCSTSDSKSIKEDLRKIVPEYMVPTYFVKLDKMPLNFNGKIDRKNLPEPEIVLDNDYVAPRNEIEEKLIKIWADLLKIEQDMVGIDTNFFESGGNSLLIMAFHSKLSVELVLEDIPVVDLFQYPSIRMFSDYLSNRDDEPLRSDDIYEDALETRMSGLKILRGDYDE